MLRSEQNVSAYFGILRKKEVSTVAVCDLYGTIVDWATC